MAITLDVFKAQTDNLISADNNELSALARYRNIKAALERYSRDMPDDYVEGEGGGGGEEYQREGACGGAASTVTPSVTQTAHGFVVNDYIYLDGATWYRATDPRVATHKVTAAATDTFTAARLAAEPAG